MAFDPLQEKTKSRLQKMKDEAIGKGGKYIDNYNGLEQFKIEQKYRIDETLRASSSVKALNHAKP